MVGVLHQDCHQAPQTRTLFGSPRSAALVNLMTNVTEQLEGYQSESDIGPALHAARQVAYWFSVFVSMMSDNASSILDTSNGYSACTTATLTSTITSTHCTTSSTSTTALTPICQPTIAPCLKSFTRRSDNCYFERSGLSVQSSATFRVHPTKRCGKYFIHSIHLFNYFYASSANRHVHSPTSLRVKLSSHLIRPYCDILKPSNKFVYFLHSWYSKSSSYFVCSSASHNDKQSTCTCQMHVKSRNYHWYSASYLFIRLFHQPAHFCFCSSNIFLCRICFCPCNHQCAFRGLQPSSHPA